MDSLAASQLPECRDQYLWRAQTQLLFKCKDHQVEITTYQEQLYQNRLRPSIEMDQSEEAIIDKILDVR
jgi:hypothetical protein